MGFIDLDKIIDLDDIYDLEKLSDIQVDLDEIFGEISDSQLMKEVESRGLLPDEDEDDTDIDLDDVEISDIAEHLSGLGYKVIESDKICDELSEMPSYKLRDLFCDMVGVNHHTPKDELMKLLSEKI